MKDVCLSLCLAGRKWQASEGEWKRELQQLMNIFSLQSKLTNGKTTQRYVCDTYHRWRKRKREGEMV